MPSNPVPTLSSFVTASGKKLDWLMTNFTTSNFSQSYCYQGKISSLPYIIAQSQYEKSRLQTEVNRVLTSYLERYYDNVELSVSVEYMNAETERVDLRIGCIVTDGNMNFDMAGLLRQESGQFITWMGENNNGG